MNASLLRQGLAVVLARVFGFPFSARATRRYNGIFEELTR